MFCMNCGKKLPDGARFCTDCGYAVLPVQYADAGSVPAAASQRPEPPRAQTAPVSEPAAAAAAAGVPPERGAGPGQVEGIVNAAEPLPPVPAEPVQSAAPAQATIAAPVPPEPVPSVAPAQATIAAPVPEPVPPAAPAQATITAPAPTQPAAPAQPKGKPRLRWLVYAGIAAAAFALGILAMILVRKTDGAETKAPQSGAVGAGKAAAAIKDTPQPTEAAEQAAVGAPVLPMTLDDLGFDAPVCADGEKLYIGRMEFDWAKKSTMAFVLTADGAEVRNVNIHHEDMNFDLPESGGHVSGMTVTEEYVMSFPYTPGGFMDMAGRFRLDDVVIDGDRASAVLTYSYTQSSLSGGASETVELGTAPVEFVLWQPGTGGAAQQTKEPAGTSSAAIRFEDTEYVCTVGGIGISDKTHNRTVTVNATGIGSVIPIRDGELVVPVQASIIADGKTYDWTGVSTTVDAMVFDFDTTAEPQTVILYPAGGKDDESTWAVYDVAQQTFTQLF